MPVAAGLIIAIGDTTLRFTDTFSLSGIVPSARSSSS